MFKNKTRPTNYLLTTCDFLLAVKTYLAVDNWIVAWKWTSIKMQVSELYLFIIISLC